MPARARSVIPARSRPSYPREVGRHTRACRGYLAVPSTQHRPSSPHPRQSTPRVLSATPVQKRAATPARARSVIPALAAGISLGSCAASGGVRGLAMGLGLFPIWSRGWAWSGLVGFGKRQCVGGCGWMVVRLPWGLFALPSFLRRQESRRSPAPVSATDAATACRSRSAPPPNVQRRMSCAYCVGSCLRRNDGDGASGAVRGSFPGGRFGVGVCI